MMAKGGKAMTNMWPLTALQRATSWLFALLADGPLPVKDVEAMAEEVGITRRTLRRARSKLGVQSSPDGFAGPRMLRLPEGSDANSVGQSGGQATGSEGQHLDETDQMAVETVGQTEGSREAGRVRSKRTDLRRVQLRRIG